MTRPPAVTNPSHAPAGRKAPRPVIYQTYPLFPTGPAGVPTARHRIGGLTIRSHWPARQVFSDRRLGRTARSRSDVRNASPDSPTDSKFFGRRRPARGV